MTVRPLLFGGAPVTWPVMVHCPEHGHEAELSPDPDLGWLLDGHLPTDQDEACITFACPGVLGAGTGDTAPCDSTVVLDFAPEDDKTR